MLLLCLCEIISAKTTTPEFNRIAILGDSMSWIGGDSCQNPRGWTYYLKQSGIAESIDLYARSGATWTNTRDTKSDLEFYSEILHHDNVLFNQALRLLMEAEKDTSKTPELIILFAGANDAWFSGKREGIFEDKDSPLDRKYSRMSLPSEVTSLAGSVALVCDILKEAFSSATFLIVSPLQMSKVSVEEIRHVADIIETVAKTRGIHIIRPDRNLPVCHDQEHHSPTFTTDGVHTNEKGAQLLSSMIITAVRTLNRK